VSTPLYIFKVVIAGPTGVGKTCLVHRLVDGRFPESTKKTIGVDFALKKVKINTEDLPKGDKFANTEITLQLWDFAGEDRFRSVLPYYATGTQGVLLGFDVSRSETMETLPEWVEILRASIRPTHVEQVPFLLIGLKCDLEGNVPVEKIDELVKSEKLNGYVSTSSLTGENVEKAFLSITRDMIEVYLK